jgi:hypothetical protein
MQTFLQWVTLLSEERQKSVPPEVLRGYDLALRRELERMAKRIDDPEVRSKFASIIDCPIIDGRGSCRGFADYVLGALLRQGVQSRYDLEQCLQYVFEKMLMSKGDSGEERNTLFTGFDPSQPDSVNHFRARFLTWVKYAVNNIRLGKIPRLSDIEIRPQGTLSIGQGRQQKGDPFDGVSPDQIAARPSTDADLHELIQDIVSLLRRKEAGFGFPLVDLFQDMISGMSVEQQRKKFGDRRVRPARQAVIQTIEDYARSTQNHILLRLLERMRSLQAGEAPPPGRTASLQSPKPVLTDKERDYSSLLQVVDRLGRPAGTAQFGSARRRWLEYPPRDATSGHRNRLEEVLSKMVHDGVLAATRTANGAYVYSPGPNAAQYRRAAPV